MKTKCSKIKDFWRRRFSSLRNSRISKKSQISQIFLYILALFIFALILYYGYFGIKSIIDQGERVAYVRFKTDLENAVQKVLPTYRKVLPFDKNNPLRIPGKITKVCFVSSDIIGTDELQFPDELKNDYPIISLSVAEGTQENVFVFPREEARQPIYLPKITVPDDFMCVETVQGRLDIVLRNIGKEILIEEYIEPTE
jgi:hypothetical protein